MGIERSCEGITSYPGLLTPAFVACSTNTGEGLVKLFTCNDIPGRWMDMRRSGTILLYSCKSAFWTQETLPILPDVKHSVILWYGPCLWLVVHSLNLRFFWQCAIAPLVQVCHCTWSVLPGFPPAFVLQTLGWEGLGTRLTKEVLHLRTVALDRTSNCDTW